MNEKETLQYEEGEIRLVVPLEAIEEIQSRLYAEEKRLGRKQCINE